jgi:hypothetical protein
MMPLTSDCLAIPAFLCTSPILHREAVMALVLLNSQETDVIFREKTYIRRIDSSRLRVVAVDVSIHQPLASTQIHAIKSPTRATLDRIPLLPTTRWLELLIEPW